MKILGWIFKNWPLLAILISAAILRFWRLEALTTFAADQGHDFLIVKRMIVDGDLTLLGPKIGPYNEIGHLYLGPAYYYLLAPVLFIFKLDPIGPAVLTVILSLGTIILIYLLCLKFFSKAVAVTTSSFYAFNSFLIDQSRAPSNPHLNPFFAILFIYSILKTQNQSIFWPIIAGFSQGLMFQLHYLTVALAPAAIFQLAIAKQLKKLPILAVAFLVAISPQILFEIRHDFFTTNLFAKQLRSGQNISFLGRFIDHFRESLQSLWQIFTSTTEFIPLSTLAALILIILFALRNKQSKKPIFLLISTVLFGLIFASLYSGPIGLHYFASIYASLLILIATAAISLLNSFKNPLFKTVIILFIAQILAANLLNLNLKAPEGYTMPAGWNLTGIKKTAQIIANDIAPNKKFNIAATLDGDTRARPYRYLVEVYGKVPQSVEDYPNVDILYLVSRDEESAIKSYTVWEVASFTPFAITANWPIQNGITLYKLEKMTI